MVDSDANRDRGGFADGVDESDVTVLAMAIAIGGGNTWDEVRIRGLVVWSGRDMCVELKTFEFFFFFVPSHSPPPSTFFSSITIHAPPF